MVKLNRAQRLALKRTFDRGAIYAKDEFLTTSQQPWCEDDDVTAAQPLTYRQFRKRVRPGYDCVMVHWCGMWLGIEPDGYTHS